VNWLRPAPLRQALTALALAAGQRNVFRLPQTSNGVHANGADAVAPAAAATRKKSLGQRFGAWFRGLAIKAAGQLRQAGPQSAVHIARATDYNADLAGLLRRQYEHFREKVPLRGKHVVLKPNLVEYHRGKVINTHPNLVAAAIELCKRE